MTRRRCLKGRSAIASGSGLVRKYYLFGEDGSGGGFYLWESREAAERMYTAEWKKMIADRYGTPPQITYFEAPVIVDNSEPLPLIALHDADELRGQLRIPSAHRSGRGNLTA